MHGLCPGVGCLWDCGGGGREAGEPRPTECRPCPEVLGAWLKPEVAKKPLPDAALAYQGLRDGAEAHSVTPMEGVQVP